MGASEAEVGCDLGTLKGHFDGVLNQITVLAEIEMHGDHLHNIGMTQEETIRMQKLSFGTP